MAVSHAERIRCPGCGQFVRRRADLDDWEAEESAYQHEHDQLEEHDCVALEQYGPQRADGPARRTSGRKASGRQTHRNYRYTCACDPAVPIRSGRLDLEVLCVRCDRLYQREPTASEQHTGTAA